MEESLRNKIRTTLLTALIFFAITLIFRRYFNIMAVMDIRPSALPPVLGLLFGPPGVLGSALGNLLADAFTGRPPLTGALGFVTQLAYGILPLLMWSAFDEVRGTPYREVRLNSVGNVARYVSIILINAAIIAVFVGSILHNFGASSFISNATLMLLLNNIVFCIVLGIPLIVLISATKSGIRNTTLSINERLVMIFLMAGIVSGGLIAVFVVLELSYAIADPVTMWMRIYMYIAINLLVFYGIAIAFLWYCERKITKPVEAIANIARGFVNGEGKRKDSRAIVEECEKLVSNKSEAGILAEAFKTMVLDIDDYIQNLTRITTENERIATELHVARQMQVDMLPNTFPAFPERNEFEIYATMEPAKEVGGDFYDFFLIDGDRLGIVIADVSGKGIPAALFMVISRTLISNWARNGVDPSDVFTRVNSQLCEGNENAMFVTAWMGILQISTGVLTYSNAGHDPPLVMKPGGEFEQIATSKNLMLAGMDGIKYKQSTIRMNPGDRLFLYTDGITEANDVKGEQYGKDRLLARLNELSGETPEDTLTHIKEDIDVFAGSEPQFDDITMLMLQVK